MNIDLSKLLSRAVLLLLGSGAAGLIAPESVALGLLVVSLLAGIYWSRVRWSSCLIVVGGLVGLAARRSGGSMSQFSSNLSALGTLAIAMIGMGVMARAAFRSRRDKRP